MGSPAPLTNLTPTEPDDVDVESPVIPPASHASSTDTEPLAATATQPSDQPACDCFAHLRPANLEARLAFDEVASELKSAPDSLPYHRQFVSVEGIVPLSSLRTSSPPGDGDGGGDDDDGEVVSPSNAGSQHLHLHRHLQPSATETETDEETPTQDPRLVWTGHYRFSFDAALELPPLGWRVGGGRWKRGKGKAGAAAGGDGVNGVGGGEAPKQQQQRANGGVDLLLAKTRVPSSGLAGLHARFAFERNGAFMLIVENPRRPSVVLGDEAFDAGSRVLAKRKCRIQLGNLAYVFEYVVRTDGGGESGEREKRFQERLGKFLRETFRGETPPRELLASPAEADHPLCDWLIRGTVGRGAFGTVTAARHRVTGKVAAAKMVVRTQRNVGECMKEIDISGKIPEHPNVSTLIDAIYERGNRWYTGPRPERVWLISTPFVRDTLHPFIQSSPSTSSFAAPLPTRLLHLRLVLFYQLLSGLAHLHAHGFIHRDIKPANLGIVSLPSPIDYSTSDTKARVVILDFGHTIQSPRALPRPGAVGTIPYLAPEMEHAEYGTGVDIWALGVVGWQLFVQKALPWKRVPEEEAVWMGRVAALKDRVDEEEEKGIYDLLVKMLEWDEEDRVSAEEALGHACFRVIRESAVIHVKKDGKKRGRKESGQGT